ncbi:MAG: LamG-like jellyroll fold domain-containing protein [Bacteroidota bacterium]
MEQPKRVRSFRKPFPLKWAMSIMGAFLLMGMIAPLSVLKSGIDAPEAVGAYMNGALPSTNSNQWDVVLAYPNLTFVDPLDMIEVPNDNKFLVAGKKGTIWWISKDSTTAIKNVVLDIESQVRTGGDCGLMSILLHPEFGQVGSPNRNYFYVYYRYAPEPTNTAYGMLRLSRFTLDPNTYTVDASTEFVYFQQFDRHHFHNGGGMFFGPDGFLYIAIGDEGGINDEYDSGQKTDEALYSGVFRIDVDNDPTKSHPIRRQPISPGEEDEPTGWPATFSQGYSIPNDNPWLSPDSSTLEEFYAIGLRSPHRMVYDSVADRIFFGDIGQGSREEISEVTKGANLQWPYKEGIIAGPKPVPNTILGTEVAPLYDYPHSMGTSVICGPVYHGTKFPTLQNKLIFTDHTVRKIWSLNPLTTELEYLATVPAFGVGTKSGVSSLYTDSDGEIYAMKLYGTDLDGGRIYKLVQSGTPSNPPTLLSATGVFKDLSTLEPSDGVYPYKMNVPFWSDAADKYRWMAIPNDGTHDSDTEQIKFKESEEWDWPSGSIWIKHFDLQIDESNPNLKKRLETRIMVMGEDRKLYGLDYRWNDSETDAVLETDSRQDTITVQTAAGPKEVVWYYPGDQECMFCHNEAAGAVLGPNTRQLNVDQFYPRTGRTANQIYTLAHLGVFSQMPDTANLDQYLTVSATDDETLPLEDRARSYLDMNCAYCHQPGNAFQALFDARLSTPLENQGYIYGPLYATGDEDELRVIVPGDLDNSYLYQRLAAVHDQLAMPPLAKNLMDSSGVELIAEWINSMEPEFMPEGNNFSRIAWWNFEDGTKDVVGESDGVLFNTAAIVNDAERGNVLDCSVDTDFMGVAHNSRFMLGQGNQDFSLAFWVKVPTNNYGTFRFLAHKGNTILDRTFAIWLRPTSNQLHFRVSTDEDFNEGGNSNSALPDNTWTHVAYIKEDNELKIFINGELDNSQTLTGKTIANDGPMTFGGSNQGQSANLMMDDIMIYDRALTEEELDDMVGGEKDFSQLAWWPLHVDGKDHVDDANGFVKNGPVFKEDSARGKVIEFDGQNDMVEIPHKPQLNVGREGKEFTMSVWVKLLEGATGSDRDLIHKGTTNNERNLMLRLNGTDNRVQYRMTTDLSFGQGGTSVNPLQIGEWTHLTYVFQSGVLKLYMNGVLDHSASVSGTPEMNEGSIYLGDSPWMPGVKCQMSNLKLFGRALSDSEILSESRDTEALVLGNESFEGGAQDSWIANLVINETDGYTNTTGATQEIEVEHFRFYASQKANPLTPVAIVEAGGNKTVAAIGTTRSSSEYNTGENVFDFVSSGRKVISLADGETLLTGFIDANPDGTGGDIGPVIPYSITGQMDNVWRSGGTAAGSSAQVQEGVAPTLGANTQFGLQRNYKYSLEFTIVGAQEMRNQKIIFPEIQDYETSVSSFQVQASATSGLPLECEVVSGPATMTGTTVTLTGTTGEVTIKASQIGNNHFVPVKSVERSFYVIPSANGTGTGLIANYFNDEALTQLALTREDSAIDFQWGSSAPAASMSPLTFSVVWEGEIESPVSETVTFITSTDDGVRLFVDNNLIIDQWTDQSVTAHTGTYTFNAWTKVPIRMEYYQNRAYAEARLSWTSTSIPNQVVPPRFLYPTATTTLPIELLNFDANLVNSEAVLDWTIIDDGDLASFVVERGTDGRVFSPIAEVEAANAMGTPYTYEWTDADPKFGDNYYRIRIMDQLGRQTLSRTERITRQGISMAIFPNPLRSGDFLNLNLYSQEDQVAQISILDVQGRRVFTENVPMTGRRTQFPVDTRDWQSGAYFVVMRVGVQKPIVEKILVQ